MLLGKYYLMDTGFLICETLLIPYHGVCHHLVEWGTWFSSNNDVFLTNQVYCSPVNPSQLFNLRHASACNAIECIFGVLKQCFKILICPPDISMDLQAHLPPALMAIHNACLGITACKLWFVPRLTMYAKLSPGDKPHDRVIIPQDPWEAMMKK